MTPSFHAKTRQLRDGPPRLEPTSSAPSKARESLFSNSARQRSGTPVEFKRTLPRRGPGYGCVLGKCAQRRPRGNRFAAASTSFRVVDLDGDRRRRAVLSRRDHGWQRGPIAAGIRGGNSDLDGDAVGRACHDRGNGGWGHPATRGDRAPHRLELVAHHDDRFPVRVRGAGNGGGTDVDYGTLRPLRSACCRSGADRRRLDSNGAFPIVIYRRDILHHRQWTASLLLAATATSCSSIKPAPAYPPHQRIADVPAPLLKVPHSDVAAIYTKFWQLSWTLDQRPENEWRGRLANVASGPMVDQLLDRKAADLGRNVHLYGAVEPHVTSASIDGTQALVRDCQNASHAGRIPLGRTPATIGVARNPIVAHLAREADGWRVVRLDYLWPGGAC